MSSGARRSAAKRAGGKKKKFTQNSCRNTSSPVFHNFKIMPYCVVVTKIQYFRTKIKKVDIFIQFILA